ncbi:MAG: hypothetical protein Fues2KO_52840 [Fuerstiella sp.]
MPSRIQTLSEGEIYAAAMSMECDSVTPELLEDSFGVDADVIDAAMGRDYRGVGFHGIIRAAAGEAGIPVPHHIAPSEYPRLAQEIQNWHDFNRAGRELRASQGWSTTNLAAINENVLNRSIHGRFEKQQSIVPVVAQERPARDFRPHKAYRMYGQGFFKKLKATGEIEHLKFGDTSFENAVDTEAIMTTLPRQAIVNDDLGIFDAMGLAIADTGFDTRERDICYALLDSSLWRTSTGANGEPINALAAGASSAFGVSALEALDDVLVNQKDRDGKPIRATGDKVLLTQSGAMARQARVIHTSEGLMDHSSGPKASTDSPSANPLRGEYETRAHTQWLSHSEMGARASSTAFFLFANPEIQPFIQVLYLNDRRTPHVETQSTAFNSLGQQMRSYWDYGIAQIDDVGAAYSPGA